MIFYEVIINFFSLNFTSIEIERERVSSTLGGVCSKTNKGKQEGGRGGGGSKLGYFDRTYFLNVPYRDESRSPTRPTGSNTAGSG